MASRVRVKKQPSEKAEQPRVEPAESKTAEQLKAETDALLDEIDEVLADVVGERSAQDFVNSYHQRGGE